MFKVTPHVIILLFFSAISCQNTEEKNFAQVAEVKEVLKSGKIEEASKALDSILIVNPENIYALELKGSIYANHYKDFRKAIEYYIRYEEINSGNALNLANIGRNYVKIGHISIGKKYIINAYETNPDNEYIILQYAYFVLKNTDEKINIYEEAILSAKLKFEANEHVDEESLKGIHNNIGHNLYLKKNFLKSAILLREGLSYGEETADHYNNLANSLQRLDSLEQALQYYDLALKKESNKSFSLNGKANTFLRMGLIDSSCVYWKRTLDSGYKFNPAWKDIWDIEDPEILISKFCKK